MRILDLSLTYHWYDMIASGVKKEEYREIKEFYIKRFQDFSKLSIHNDAFQHYDAVRFHRGQGGKTTMLVECNGIHIGHGKPEWGAVPGETYFVIELGEILEENGSKS